MGALETDSDQLFRNATVYPSEVENRYLTGEARRWVIYHLYKLPMVKRDNPRVLLQDGQILTFGQIRVECLLVPEYMVRHIDDKYLFTGYNIWVCVDGGYSFISTLAGDNRLTVKSMQKLEANLRARNREIAVITGHTGWPDNLDFVFAHRCAGVSRACLRCMTVMMNRMIRRKKPEQFERRRGRGLS